MCHQKKGHNIDMTRICSDVEETTPEKNCRFLVGFMKCFFVSSVNGGKYMKKTSCLVTFKRLLKTHLFRAVYEV